MDPVKPVTIGSFLLGAVSAGVGMYLYLNSTTEQHTIDEESEASVLKKSHRRRASNITSPQVIRAICFDLDGTLIKTEHLWFQLLKDASVYFNGPPFVTLVEYTKYFGQSMQQNVEQFLPNITVDQLDEYCAKHYHEYIHLIDIVPGAVDALKFSSEVCGRNIYLTTNCPRYILDLILKAPQFAFIQETFEDRIYCAGDIITDASGNQTGVISPKPAVDLITQVSLKTGVPSTEIMLVGDSIYDMQCIHAANGVGIALHYPHIDIDMSITDVKIDSLVEFYELQKMYKFINSELPPL